MSQEVSKSDILQAVLELTGEVKGLSKRQDEMQTELKRLSKQQDEMQTELKGLSQQQCEMKDELKGLSKQLTDTDKKLTSKVDIVDAKIDILSNRLLETQAEVNVLKSAK